MKQKRLVFGVSTLLVTGVFTAGMASAAGCNGVVDQLKWGCAAWDNNNGPQYPHYKKPAAPAPQAHRPAPVPQVSRPAPAPQAHRPAPVPQVSRPAPVPQAVYGGGGRAPVLANDGASLIGQDAASAQRNSGQTGIVAGGGGNAVNKNNLIGQDGASLIGDGGGTMRRK